MNIKKHTRSKNGFTLIELMIALTISSILMIAIYSIFRSQQRSYFNQSQAVEMQQNVRAGMDLLLIEIRQAGYNPLRVNPNPFTITDIRQRDINYTVDPTADSAIQFTADDTNDNGILDPGETISYSLCNAPIATPADRDGILDLARNNGGGRQLFAESIEAFGLAFAFDWDFNGAGDGNLDTYTDAGGTDHIIWAIDSDGDNDLDTNLDTDNDGDIDADDGPNAGQGSGAGWNGLIPGTGLIDTLGRNIPDVPPARIRAVRVWILARTRHRDKGYLNPFTYVAGNQVRTPATDGNPGNDDCHMLLFSTIVQCRNMGL